jgi:hypothetical protein
VAGVVLSLGVLAPACRAGADERVLDIHLTVLARQALQRDRLLANVNIGVHVKERVATLWGPVPSDKVAERAVRLLRQIPELREVRSELSIDLEPPPILDRQGPAPAGPRWLPGLPGEGAARPPTPPPAILTRHPGKGAAHTPQLPAIAVPTPPGVPAAGAPAEPAMAPGADLAREVRKLVQGDERYRRVQVAAESGTVFLSGVVYRWEDMHELSRAVARLPGVVRVVLRGVRTDP